MLYCKTKDSTLIQVDDPEQVEGRVRQRIELRHDQYVARLELVEHVRRGEEGDQEGRKQPLTC